MNINDSDDISVLDFTGLFDISNAVPKISINSLCAGPHLGNCIFWITVTSPSNSPLHTGTESVPDFPLATPWTSWIMAENWQQVFFHVEWSGAPYTITLFVKDNKGNLYSQSYTGSLCPPPGNDGSVGNNFGYGSARATVKCNDAQLYAQDTTNYLYKGTAGTQVSQDWRIVYPADSNGDVHTPNTASGMPYAYLPLYYDGDNHMVYMNSVRDYTIGTNMFARIKIKATLAVNVMCNVNWCNIVGPYQNLLNKGACAPCGNNVAKDDLLKVNSQIMLLNMVNSSGCTDIDTGALYTEIKNTLAPYGGCATNGSNANNGNGSSSGSGGSGGGINPGGSGSGGSSATTLPVIDQSTGVTPVSCPGNIYPRSVFAPDGVTFIGMAYSSADLISIMNANAAWSALGVASDQGNCQVSFMPVTGAGVIPPVVTLPGVGTGTGTAPDPDATACVNGVQQYIAIILGDCNGQPLTAFPFPLSASYGGGPATFIDNVSDPTELISILMGDSNKPSSITYTYANIPGVIAVIVHNSSCAIYNYPISISGPGVCNPLTIPILDSTTQNPPTGCPGNIYPQGVFEPNGTTFIGYAYSAADVVVLMNSNTAWSNLGTASLGGNCTVSFTKFPYVNTVPPVIVTPGTDTGCVVGTSNRIVQLNPLCSGGSIATTLNFPFVGYVSYTGDPFGVVTLGTITSVADIIARLMAEPSKPLTVTYTDATIGTNIAIRITDTGCALDPSYIIALYGDVAEGGNIFMIGGNYDKISPAYDETIDIIGLQADTTTWPTPGGFMGVVCAADQKYLKWHSINFAGKVWVTNPETGGIEIVDITDLNHPAMSGSLHLPIVVSGPTGNFKGKAPDGSGTYFKGLYFVTDVHINLGVMLYVVESITGTLWGIDTSTNTVTVQFQSNKLIGKCPRVMLNNKIYFTQDGTIETDTAQSSTVPVGYIPIWDATTGDATGITQKQITLNNNDPVLSACYQLDTIFFGSKLGTVTRYTVSTDTVLPSSIVLVTTCTSYQNMSVSGMFLYLSGYGQGTWSIRLIGSAMIPDATGVHDIGGVDIPGGTPDNRLHWNFKLAAGCTGILTYDKGDAPGAGISVFSLGADAMFLYQKYQNYQSLYNVVIDYNFNMSLTNTYCALP